MMLSVLCLPLPQESDLPEVVTEPVRRSKPFRVLEQNQPEPRSLQPWLLKGTTKGHQSSASSASGVIRKRSTDPSKLDRGGLGRGQVSSKVFHRSGSRILRGC